jgi:hypothetical protein
LAHGKADDRHAFIDGSDQLEYAEGTLEHMTALQKYDHARVLDVLT